MSPARWSIGVLLFVSCILVGSAQNSSSTEEFCVAIATADPTALQEGLNWACGMGGADCSAIQEGQPCYVANNLVEIASYAYNDYYHKTVSTGGTCNFNGTAQTTNTDPSHGSCTFAGSSQSSTTTNNTSTNTTPTALSPLSSLFSPPPPSITGFSNTNITSTDGSFSKSSRNAVSSCALFYTACLVLKLHLLWGYY